MVCVAAGASLQCYTHEGDTPLLAAISAEQVDATEELLSQGAKPTKLNEVCLSIIYL